jgi:DNA invertase Pin-like site-specific DNA recombinase
MRRIGYARCRATRSMLDGVHLIERINARGALIKVLDKPHLDLTTPLGRGFIAFLSAMAEDERQRILARCNAGRQVAVAKGVRFGPNASSPTTSKARPASASRPRELSCNRQDVRRAPRHDC